MDEPKPHWSTVWIVSLTLLLAFAFVGNGDYADEVARENRALRAAVERCRLAERLDEVPEAGAERVDYPLAARGARP